MTTTLEPTTETAARFTVNTDAFRDAVSSAASIIKSRSPKPSLSCILLEVTTDCVTVKSTDMERSYINRMNLVQVESVGSLLINGEALLDALRLMSDETVTVRQVAGLVQVTGKSSKKSLPLWPVKEFPTLSEELADCKTLVTISGEDLCDIVNSVKWAMPDSSMLAGSRWTDGINLKTTASGIAAAATNGHCVSVSNRTLKAEMGELNITNISILSAIKLFESAKEVQISTNGNRVLFSSDDISFVSVLSDRGFPSLDGIAPTKSDCPTLLLIDRNAMLDAARQARHFTNELTTAVILDVTSESTRIRSSGAKGDAEITISGKLTGPPITIGLNADYLVALLQSCESDEVEFWFQKPNRPICVSEKNHFVVVMPVNLN